MLTLILKDLFENRKTWLLFSAASLSVLLLGEFVALTPEKREGLAGFTYGLVVASGLLFTQSVIVNERKHRHFIFLKSLPISDSQIILGKLLSVLGLTLSLTNLPFIYELLNGRPSGLPAWMMFNSLITAYATLLFLFGLKFRSQAALFLPLYAMLGLLVLFSSIVPEPSSLPAVAVSYWFVSGVCMCLAFGFAVWSIHVFSHKELEL